ncbi:MAG: iron-sulfur cluster assembly accessory protein [Gammaproteobacteria bacterium]|nr:iron-sulfur cluster assembly accessory protein [Gammaproteobacteria bacterium]
MTTAAFPHTVSEAQMIITNSARTKLAELMAAADDDLSAIRVFVSGGGCGGMQYGMTFVESTEPYDSILEADGFKVAIDPVALGYLEGVEIDFRENGMNASFVFNNVFKSVGGTGACSACGSAGGGCGG